VLRVDPVNDAPVLGGIADVSMAEDSVAMVTVSVGDVETVAGMIVWLALDAPDYITAERLNVSGGLDKD